MRAWYFHEPKGGWDRKPHFHGKIFRIELPDEKTKDDAIEVYRCQFKDLPPSDPYAFPIGSDPFSTKPDQTMSKSSFLRLETAEKNIEYWDGETKVAFINDSGTIQATRGHAERKEELEKWLHSLWSSPHIDGNGNPLPPPYLAGEAAAYHKWEKEKLPSGEGEEPSEETAPESPENPEHSEDSHTENAVEPSPVVAPQSGAIPPKGSPELGEKDPSVISWWFSNDPEKAKAKYARCKHLWPR